MRVTKRTADQHNTWSQRGSASTWVGWGIAVICLGVLAIALPQPRDVLARLLSFAAHPTLMARAYRLRAAYPEMLLDVDFEGYQQLANVVDAGMTPEPVCVSATVSIDRTASVARVCRMDVGSGPMPGVSPTLRITTEDDGTLLGIRQAVMSPAGVDAALAMQYVDALRTAAVPAPKVRIVRMSVNGSQWGLYLLEELLSVETMSEQGLPSRAVIVSFEMPLARDTTAGAPGSDFARARFALACAAGGTEAEWAAVVADDPLLAATGADALHRLQDVLTADLLPSQVFDAESFGQFMALTALWRGVFLPDWQTLQLIYNPESDRFVPLGTARQQSAITPLPPQFYRDPEIQLAYVRAMDMYSDPDLIDALLNTSRLPEIYAALGGDVLGMAGLRDSLAANQAAMRALIAPSETLRAWLEDDDGYLRLALEATEPFPVEILGLDLGEQGIVTLAREWVLDPSPVMALVDTPAIVLKARTTDVPVVASIRIPLDALPSAGSNSGLDLWVVTRVWGLAERVRVPVIVSPTGDVYGES